MKNILAASLLILGASVCRAGEVILPYSSFGPQAAAYKLIGMEWWQWESQGDGPHREYPIKVVVFWDQILEETAKRHPASRERLQDFRYVEYSKAIEQMTKVVQDFKKEKLDASPIEKAIAELKKARNDCSP